MEYMKKYGKSVDNFCYNSSRELYSRLSNKEKKTFAGFWKRDDEMGDTVVGPNFSIYMDMVLKKNGIDLRSDMYKEWSYEAGIRDCLMEEHMYVPPYDIK